MTSGRPRLTRLGALEPEQATTAPQGDLLRRYLDDVKRRCHYWIVDELGPELDRIDDLPSLRTKAHKKVLQFLAEERTPLAASDRQEVLYEVLNNVLGY
ncbi:MAG TPA: hypothetical protein VJM51_03285, partial [Dehalococcoidia bacterium]|nr:hypothetical protein [Dehalococcoidia bacterium]